MGQRSPIAESSLAIELMCWLVALLAPILRYANGPAVTPDQFAIQLGLSCTALFAAVVLRMYDWRRRRRAS